MRRVPVLARMADRGPSSLGRRPVMSTDRIRVAVADGVGVLTLDNPPMNVVTLALTRELDAALGRLAGAADIRVLIVTGAGERAFCSGSDIKEFSSVADDVVGKKLGAENAVFSRLAAFPKPTIAAVEAWPSAAASSSPCAAIC